MRVIKAVLSVGDMVTLIKTKESMMVIITRFFLSGVTKKRKYIIKVP